MSSTSLPKQRFTACLLASLILCSQYATSLPLSTYSRWIVDESGGSRVKLACVNWVSHLQPMLAEGLSKQPLENITSTIKALGFNCVRLTWPLFMFTNNSLGQQTVSQSFTSLNLSQALAGIQENNPGLLSLPLVEAFKEVVSCLASKEIMIVLDNHISLPEWCCSDNDGNGFWGDEYFDPQVWVEGLRIVASTFKDKPQVVAMSMRNELRGQRQNVPDWYKFMQMGAEAIHRENPNLLIIHSGLNYDTNLHFLFSQPLNLSESLKHKVVYEVHWYSFTSGNDYTTGNLNEKCASITAGVMNRTGFLVTPNMSFTGPLFISEFGIDQRGLSSNDNRFITCFFAFAAAGDFDWAYWTLPGSYYIRDGKLDMEETFGILNTQWDAPRNRSFVKRLQALQQPFIQDVASPVIKMYQVFYHPASGLCLQKDSDNKLVLGLCDFSSQYWSYTPEGRITLVGTYLSVGAEGEGQSAVLKTTGTELNGPWDDTVSETQLQFATVVGGVTVCLDGSSHPSVLTSKCICTSDNECESGDDPSGQWFKLVRTSGLNPVRESEIQQL